MTIKVIMNGVTSYPSYDPEHTEAVLAFYAENLAQGTIQSWEVVA